jgi:hypothetical protein
MSTERTTGAQALFALHVALKAAGASLDSNEAIARIRNTGGYKVALNEVSRSAQELLRVARERMAARDRIVSWTEVKRVNPTYASEQPRESVSPFEDSYSILGDYDGRFHHRRSSRL